jgi:hypothetical protein
MLNGKKYEEAWREARGEQEAPLSKEKIKELKDLAEQIKSDLQ